MRRGLKIYDQFRIMKTRLGAFDSERGRNFCRACNSHNVVQVLDLGNLPIANELPITNHEIIDLFPLCFGICTNCGLGQVGEPVSRERLFSDYRYLSSISETWLRHAKNFAQNTVEALKLTSSDLVIEIASNDGYLLQYFKNSGIKVLGVEPAKNIAMKASLNGIETISEFFGVDTAKEISNLHAAPNLIIANNVAAHVPNLRDFFAGLEALAGDQTLISIENPSILNLLKENQFDTIYHEHYSYLSLTALNPIFKKHELKIVEVEKLETHGGSLRVTLVKARYNYLVQKSVYEILEEETKYDPLNVDLMFKFQESAKVIQLELVKELKNAKEQGLKVAAYGAAAKGNTLLNYSQINTDLVSYVVDLNPNKQGKYLPGSHIPVVSENVLSQDRPDLLLILPWNLATEIKNQLHWLSESGTKFLRAIPKLEYF
jgi:hypothetical protein